MNTFISNNIDHKMNKTDLLDLYRELENIKILCNENDKEDTELILETMLKILKNPNGYKKLKCIRVDFFNGIIMLYSNEKKKIE